MTSVFIHSTADVSPLAHIGPRARVWNNAQIREGACVGQDCVISKDVYIDKDVIVGDRVKIQNGALLYRPLLIEDGVFIGPQVAFVNDLIPRSITPEGVLKSEDDWTPKQTVVRSGASFGTHATILPGAIIGPWAMIGAGAVVSTDVQAYSLMLGIPARPHGWVCRCGSRLTEREEAMCRVCGRLYRISPTDCQELPSPAEGNSTGPD